ncbi:hypothetical protein COCNU_11G003270 [Cocos nucifera]|uniref:Uncharacterized protein n=1 Tax=Cocos nucifera TaxID=13894 RepID=A0A8K0N9P7_COCNU|nr:hypothetical protein COCNU_11G003270 [Cocos nucifera]
MQKAWAKPLLRSSLPRSPLCLLTGADSSAGPAISVSLRKTPAPISPTATTQVVRISGQLESAASSPVSVPPQGLPSQYATTKSLLRSPLPQPWKWMPRTRSSRRRRTGWDADAVCWSLGNEVRDGLGSLDLGSPLL